MVNQLVEVLLDDPGKRQHVAKVATLVAMVTHLNLLQFLVSRDALQVCIFQSGSKIKFNV